MPHHISQACHAKLLAHRLFHTKSFRGDLIVHEAPKPHRQEYVCPTTTLLSWAMESVLILTTSQCRCKPPPLPSRDHRRKPPPRKQPHQCSAWIAQMSAARRSLIRG
ncbi:hypothetical protein FH972_026111 [Carpinus fangiana]|uniref:Uncharacterized protein n=1 Tax=Carpinus fangiana TaxID=176857 RepID=A0A5N6L304_9ROSI|nr:hypothetical protein FH972_026111 [Carpinus fangiana]